MVCGASLRIAVMIGAMSFAGIWLQADNSHAKPRLRSGGWMKTGRIGLRSASAKMTSRGQ